MAVHVDRASAIAVAGHPPVRSGAEFATLDATRSRAPPLLTQRHLGPLTTGQRGDPVLARPATIRLRAAGELVHITLWSMAPLSPSENSTVPSLADRGTDSTTPDPRRSVGDGDAQRAFSSTASPRPSQPLSCSFRSVTPTQKNLNCVIKGEGPPLKTSESQPEARADLCKPCCCGLDPRHPLGRLFRAPVRCPPNLGCLALPRSTWPT